VNGDYVTVSWAVPYDGSSPITGYKVFIRHFDEVSYSEEYENCSYDDITILDNRLCTIPITHLIANPYNLGWGQGVYAKISAINIVGESERSEEANGAIILTAPDKPIFLTNEPS
jgi:hypothetical protein